MIITESGLGARLSDFGEINLPLTLDCGQAFRWERLTGGAWAGIAGEKSARIIKDGGDLLFLGCGARELGSFWANYFDLSTDYAAILERLGGDKTLKSAIEKYGCIRILRQDPWEAICSFIISACNNIPRIKGIIYRLSREFGEASGENYAFPSPERLAVLNEEDFSPVRAGFRVKGILDAARKFASGELIIAELERLPYDELKNKLTGIYGVGDKVADCAILFGFGRHEVYPVDRHIKRITAEIYPHGLPDCAKGCEGIAQQYLFCLQRNIKGSEE